MASVARRIALGIVIAGIVAVPAHARPEVPEPIRAAVAVQGTGAPDMQRWRLTRHGFGRLTVGLDRAAIERRTGRSLRFVYNTGPCAIWSIRGVRGLSIMTARGRLARVDVGKGAWRTSTGIRVGDSESTVRARYPRLHTRPHPYDPEGQYLIVPGPNRRVVFETDGRDRVTSFRGGRMPHVMYIEGCA